MSDTPPPTWFIKGGRILGYGVAAVAFTSLGAVVCAVAIKAAVLAWTWVF